MNNTIGRGAAIMDGDRSQLMLVNHRPLNQKSVFIALINKARGGGVRNYDPTENKAITSHASVIAGVVQRLAYSYPDCTSEQLADALLYALNKQGI